MAYQFEPKTIIFYLSACACILSLVLVLSPRKESFELAKEMTKECQTAASSYCNQACDEKNMIDPANRVKLGKAVLDSCGPNFEIMNHCKKTHNDCPIGFLDRVIGGRHDRAYKPLEYVRTIDAQDPRQSYTKNVTTYQW